MGFAGGLSWRISNPEMREFRIFYQIENSYICSFRRQGNEKYNSEKSSSDTVILVNIFLNANIAIWLYGVAYGCKGIFRTLTSIYVTQMFDRLWNSEMLTSILIQLLSVPLRPPIPVASFSWKWLTYKKFVVTLRANSRK